MPSKLVSASNLLLLKTHDNAFNFRKSIQTSSQFFALVPKALRVICMSNHLPKR